MSTPSVVYLHLGYEDYKSLEEQMRACNETCHTSTPGGFYHKSIRLKINAGLIIEFHGPLVGGEGHAQNGTEPYRADEREQAAERRDQIAHEDKP